MKFDNGELLAYNGTIMASHFPGYFTAKGALLNYIWV